MNKVHYQLPDLRSTVLVLLSKILEYNILYSSTILRVAPEIRMWKTHLLLSSCYKKNWQKIFKKWTLDSRWEPILCIYIQLQANIYLIRLYNYFKRNGIMKKLFQKKFCMERWLSYWISSTDLVNLTSGRTWNFTTVKLTTDKSFNENFMTDYISLVPDLTCIHEISV